MSMDDSFELSRELLPHQGPTPNTATTSDKPLWLFANREDAFQPPQGRPLGHDDFVSPPSSPEPDRTSQRRRQRPASGGGLWSASYEGAGLVAEAAVAVQEALRPPEMG